MWIYIVIPIIIVLIVFIIISLIISKIKKAVVNEFLILIRIEKKREEERKKRVLRAVNLYSHKINQLSLLNNCFVDLVPNKIPEFSFSVFRQFYSKRSLDKAYTGDYMYEHYQEAKNAINYKACYNDLINQYESAIKQIGQYKTPAWAIEESKVDVNEFLRIEEKIYGEKILKLTKCDLLPTVYVLLSYTSPAGRNHRTKSNTLYYDYDPDPSCYKSLKGSYSDCYHRKNNVSTNKQLENEENIVTTTIDCINLELDNTLDAINSFEFFNRVDIESIIIPPSVKIIKKEAFKGCLNLKEVTILGEDIIIEDEAFSGCYHLNKINYPKTEIINEKAFTGCYRLNIQKLTNK